MKNRRGFLGLLCAIIIAVSIQGTGWEALRVRALEPEEAAWVEEARGVLKDIVTEREVMALVYLCQEYAVRREPSLQSEPVAVVPGGQTVFIEDAYMDDNYEAWTYVSFYDGETQMSGYVQRNNLACSDERFLNWEAEYGMNPAAYMMMTMATETDAAQVSGGDAGSVSGGDAGPTISPELRQFPESYHPALKALKEQHPNWTFVAMNTGLDWNTVIANELVGGKSLVDRSFAECTREGAYDDSGWYYASKGILEYFMDPRNSLTENTVFQFEQLTYNESYHTEAAVEAFLNNTFMNSSQNAPGTVMTFAHIFWAIGKEEGRKVSPFHLASRVYQEQGRGTSALISGTYPGYEGYYNYFNIKASGKTTEEIIKNGLKYAKDNNWYNAYFSILGGSNIISENYITKGQDTLYLQKYNVNPRSHYPLYTHQYMQNVAAPTSEAKSIKKLYASAESLNSPFVFKIPVFNNMPDEPCPMPQDSTNVVLETPAGYTDATIYLDGVPYAAEVRNGRTMVDAPNKAAKTAVMYKYNTNGVPTGMSVWSLSYAGGKYTATPLPGLTDLLTYHGFSIRITGKSGIRFKTGISPTTRETLLSTGISGYKLKEYGTLVMSNANYGSYPMIKGGEKVLSGMAYGKNANGVLEDKVFEYVDGRYRYTSVLVGLPAEQYKAEFAFRGYIVLEKDGVETTLYGPVVARSIYNLAKQILDMGMYAPDSSADVFLRKLISDADAVAQ